MKLVIESIQKELKAEENHIKWIKERNVKSHATILAQKNAEENVKIYKQIIKGLALL